LESLNPFWLEKPVRWMDDRRELELIFQRTLIPLSGDKSELTRDWLLTPLLTLGLLVMAIGFKSAGRITRIEGLLLVLVYISYTGYLGYSVLA